MDQEPDYEVKTEDPLYQAVNLENSKGNVPIVGITQEFIKVEGLPSEPFNLESPSEVLPIIAVKDEMLDIKEEPDILYPMVVYGDDADECNTDNKNIKLRDGSDDDFTSLCVEETVNNNTASPDSGMLLSLNVKPSSVTDSNVPSAHQYSRATGKKINKNRKTSSVQSTETQSGFHKTIKSNKPVLQNEIFNTSERTLKCNESTLNICDTCHKCFSKPYNLKRHMGIHTETKPYTCDTCHKCFNQFAQLKRHNRIHTESKPYTCDTCHKCFSVLSNLETHIRIHTKSKPYTCDTCHKCFSVLYNLKTHIRIHTNSKPYSCDTCHKRFRVLSNLKKHNRIHTGSKPYTCDTCHKCFREQSGLKKHIRIHTGIKPYTCDTCHKSFSELSNLKKHIQIHKRS